MKKIVLSIILLAFVSSIYSQNWQWAAGEGGQGMERAWDIACDADGNLYVTGQYTDILEINGQTYPFNGISDVFVVKYNSEGENEYVVTFGGDGEEIGLGIDTDKDGNAYVSGYFTDTIQIGQYELIATGWDMFIVKLNNKGVVQWVEHPQCNGSELAYGIACTQNGDVYLTGWYQDTLFFEDDEYVPNYGGSDIFVAKYNTNGDFLWARHAGRESVEYGYKIDTDGNDNCYITGVASDSSNFGGMYLSHSGAFIAKYNSAGQIQSLGVVTGGAGVNNISVNDDGTGHIAGRVTGYGIFIGANDTIVTADSTDDAYLAQFNDDCQWQWILHAHGPGSDKGRSVYTDNEGNAYFCGSFNDDFTIADTTLIPGYNDIFATKINPNGIPVWVVQGGGAGSDIPSDIVAAGHNCYVTGWYTGPSSLGDIQLQAYNNGDVNFFLGAIAENISNKSLVNYHGQETFVYPNPYRYLSHIKISDAIIEGKNVLLKIYTHNGNLIYCQEYRNYHQVLKPQLHLASGMYFFCVISENTAENGKFIIVK